MNDAHTLESEQAVSTAERLEETDDPDDIDPLDVEATVDLRGNVGDITLTLTTGGPHVEVNVTNGTVTAYWGDGGHTVHCDSDVLDVLDDRYRYQFEDHVLA